MDWTLTGAVAGVAVLAGVAVFAGVVAYESFAPEQARETHTYPVLIPAPERPAANVNAITNAPVVAYAPPQQTNGTDIFNRADRPVAALAPSRVETPAPAKRVDPTIPAPPVGTLNPPPADKGTPARKDAKTQSQVSADSWKVERTAKANYYNLGGHIDANGVVDSLASSYLRNALKNQKNYAKLPPQIKTYIDASNINLAMIAGYRGMLGVNDRKMEDEQGVRFIRVATRSIEEDTDLEDAAAGIDAPPLDLTPLDRMAFDLKREMMVSDPRH